MARINRRDFLKGATAAGGSLLLLKPALGTTQVLAAQNNGGARPQGFAMLSDLTRCVGCRRCEAACNRAHKLAAPKVPFEDPSVFKDKRRTEANAFTVVNRYRERDWKKPVYRKIQCNHCNEPACASACLVGALKKTPEGPVIYNEDVCIGCRYCMTACPFYAPAFEYFDARSPAIRKCTMCYHRVTNGVMPACAEACAVQAITFGKRNEMIALARNRIMSEPDRYIDHIYGEYEVGGTSWLYISGVPFDDVDLPTDLGKTAYPELTREFLSAVPLVIAAWPVLFGGIYTWMKRREQAADTEHATPTKEVAGECSTQMK